MPYIEMLGTEEQKMRWLPKCCTGEHILAIGMTEPGAGSALTDLTTRAVLKGDHYVLNGQKRFTLPLGVMDFMGEHAADWNMILAFLTLAMGYIGLPRDLAEWIATLKLSPFALIVALALFYLKELSLQDIAQASGAPEFAQASRKSPDVRNRMIALSTLPEASVFPSGLKATEYT